MSTPSPETPALAACWSSTGSGGACLKLHGECPKQLSDHVAARTRAEKVPRSCRRAVVRAHPAGHACTPTSSVGALSP
jgi:hypothetical protein